MNATEPHITQVQVKRVVPLEGPQVTYYEHALAKAMRERQIQENLMQWALDSMPSWYPK